MLLCFNLAVIKTYLKFQLIYLLRLPKNWSIKLWTFWEFPLTISAAGILVGILLASQERRQVNHWPHVAKYPTTPVVCFGISVSRYMISFPLEVHECRTLTTCYHSNLAPSQKLNNEFHQSKSDLKFWFRLMWNLATDSKSYILLKTVQPGLMIVAVRMRDC